MTRVAVAGIIGAGKTTWVDHAVAHGWAGSYEDVSGNPFLARFYEGDDAVVLPMELWLANARRDQWDAAGPGPVIFDRTAAEDLVFADILRDDGRLPDEHHAVYRRAFDRINTEAFDAVIWLDVSPETAYARIRARARRAEMAVDPDAMLAYLTRLHTAYAAHMAARPNVIRIDWESPSVAVIEGTLDALRGQQPPHPAPEAR